MFSPPTSEPLSWRPAHLIRLLLICGLLAGHATRAQQGWDAPADSDTASTGLLRRLQRRVNPGDTLATDTLRVQTLVLRVDSLVRVQQAAAARVRKKHARQDSLLFLKEVRALDKALRTNGRLPAEASHFDLKPTSPGGAVLTPASKLILRLPARYAARFEQLSLNSSAINASRRTGQLTILYLPTETATLSAGPGNAGSSVSTLVVPAGMSAAQRRYDASFLARSQVARRTLDVLYAQFQQLGRAVRPSRPEYVRFEQENYFTEQGRLAFRNQIINILTAELAKASR